MEKQIKIGWSEVSITPDRKISLRGQFYERVSQYVETPITVTAMAVDSGDEQMVICSCDLTSIGEILMDRVREQVAGKIDLDPMKIMIHATHTHNSHTFTLHRNGAIDSKSIDFEKLIPDRIKYIPLETSKDVMTPEESLEFLTQRISQAVIEAWNGRKNAMYACGFGRVAVGMCRRVCYDDGTAKMWGDANSANFTHLEGGNDNGMELMFTYDDKKNLTGIVANIACPSQVLEQRSFISSDYWGKVKINLRKKYGEGLFVLGLCSPAGDQCPRDLVRWVEPETPIADPNVIRENPIDHRADGSMFDIQGTVRIGRRIATEIEAALEEVDQYFTCVPFAHEVKMLNLPLRRVTMKERDEAEKAIAEFIRNAGDTINYMDTALMHVHTGTLNRFEAQKTQNVYSIEAHFIRLGDIAFATNPFELFLDYGNQIRARCLAKQSFLIQMCCGASGYLPTESAEKNGHYSAYVSSGYVGHIGGEQYVRETLETLNGFFAE